MIATGKELRLDALGLNQIDKVHRNLSVESLIEETVKNGEGIIAVSYTHLTLPTILLV